jgi:hypothetical protein
MTSMSFHDQQQQAQINWRKAHISSQAFGYQNGKQYEHIIPPRLWHETLWQGIRKELPAYVSSKSIQSHTGTHNLLSSWVVCANLYFIIKINHDFKQLMLGFLQKYVSQTITGITDIELEFALDGVLTPENLLGEQSGKRGSGQTSPDVAFIVEAENGEGLVLTECKYTEHSFYPCSARRKIDSQNKPANPNPSRCMNDAKGYSYKSICHQKVWGRIYWDNLTLSQHGENVLKNCPASTAGYQLFRQHSLAEGVAVKGDYGLVVSSVAFDARNQKLMGCLSSTGIKDFTTGWEKLFTGRALFTTWTHQQWVEYVRQNGIGAL